MDYRIEIKELEDFYKLVDEIIEKIESKEIASNPLKPDLESLKEENLEELLIEETLEEKENNSKELILPEKTNTKETLIINEDGAIIAHYVNAVEMAKINQIHATTARNRCAGNFVDENNNTWYYRNKYEEAIK
jgi:hypothetical protein